jgi:4-amino-4-deoxy-L-arabinose transferase-like glycosyltransferase
MTPRRDAETRPSVASGDPDLRHSGTAAGRVVAGLRKHPLRYGIAFVLLVTCASLVLSAQGWKSRVPAFDLLTYFYAAHEFLESGTLPQHGDTGSYGSYKPPGTAWLLMPGTVLLSDPRAAAYVGTGLLHFATLLGIFLLAWRCFGMWPACLAVLLYGLSRHGLFLAGSLWPNGRPDFYVWFALFTSLWAIRRNARYLAAAVTVWGLGMHVDMAIAPALFILPVVWLSYRPPVRPLPLLIAGLIVLTVWSPYLRLEATRGFADMKSQLFLRYMLPEHYRQSWCDTSLTLMTWREPVGSTEHGASAMQGSSLDGSARPIGLSSRLRMVKDKVLSNFTEATRLPGLNVLLLVLVLVMVLLCTLPGVAGEGPAVAERPPPRQRRLRLMAMLLIATGLILQAIISVRIPGAAFILASGSAKKLPQVLLLVGIMLLGGPWLLAVTQRALRRIGIEFHPTMPMRLLVINLVVPWFILVVLAEPGKPERFWWVWPLQVILLAASVAYLLPKFPVPRAIVATAQLALVLLVVLNRTLVGRIESWRAEGWAGKDPEEVQVIDYVANQIRGEGKSKAAIGYQLFIYPFMAQYHITNPIYKVGGELELMLASRHGIENTDQCAEGISPNDEYRIVQIRPRRGPEEPMQYFDAPLDNRFRLLRRFGLYEVFKRG